MRNAMIFIGVMWAGVVSAFAGMDDDRAALGLLAMLAVPATAAIIVFMIAEYRRHIHTLDAQVTREQI